MADIKSKTAEEFMKAYESLCKEYGFALNIVPTWIPRDDGTFSTKLQVSIGKLPEEK